MFLSLLAVTQPLAMLATARMGSWLAPDMQGTLADLPWWAGAGLMLLADDLTQYWWHRLSHSPLLWSLHRAWRWDEPRYRIRALRPLMWVMQRTISTPATHWAHHAITNADGVGHYKGNFGNLLFLWDLTFDSAHITQQYPHQVGLRDDQLFGPERCYRQMFYPLLKSDRECSALKIGGTIYDEARPPLA